VLPEARFDLDRYSGAPRLVFHGPVSQPDLAAAFRRGSVLVLPSLEEGFGLVVPHALNTGLPCIVSDRVGAKDLIQHRRNGSIFPCENEAALLDELNWWEDARGFDSPVFGWDEPAKLLLKFSEAQLARPVGKPPNPLPFLDG
jgi:glycosyltransferase involved in cell wall biosynthesis